MIIKKKRAKYCKSLNPSLNASCDSVEFSVKMEMQNPVEMMRPVSALTSWMSRTLSQRTDELIRTSILMSLNLIREWLHRQGHPGRQGQGASALLNEGQWQGGLTAAKRRTEQDNSLQATVPNRI